MNSLTNLNRLYSFDLSGKHFGDTRQCQVEPISTKIKLKRNTSAHGTIFGIIVFFGATGGAIGPFFAGQLFDMTGSYTIIFRSITI